jgi:hypothetical protein
MSMKNSLYLARLSTMNFFMRNVTKKKNQCPEMVYTTINGEARTIFTFPQFFTAHTAVNISYFYSIRNSLFLLTAHFVSGNKRWFLIRLGHFLVGPPATIKLMGNCYSLCDLHPGNYSSNQVTCYLSSLPFHTAAVGTAWSLLGSPPNGQAVLYIFQKTFNPVDRIFGLSMREFLKRW